MEPIDVDELKARFSECLAAVEAGQTVVIVRCNKPIARLVPIEPEDTTPAPRIIGLAKGKVRILPSFFEPLEQELLDLFDGSAMLPGDPLNPADQP